MKTLSLPPVQAAANPVPNANAEQAADNAAASGNNFQQVLARQVRKEPAPAQTDKRSANNAQPAAKERDAKAAATDAKPKTETENAARAGSMAGLDISALGMPGLSTEDAAAPTADETEAPVLASDQLPGLFNVLTPQVAAGARLGPAKADVAPASDSMLAGADKHARGGTAKPELGGKDAVLALQTFSADVAGLPADKLALATIADGEQSPQPDFAKLLAGREATAMPVAAPAMLNAAQAVAAQQHVIEPRLGSKGWDQAVGQKMVWMVGAMEQSATLTLNPPDLGPLQVVIQVHNEQASATFVSENPEVRQALQDNIATLRSMMSGAGVTLGEANIHSGSQAQQQFEQSQRQQSERQQTGGSVQHGRSMEAPAARIYGGNGLVDTFA